MEGKVAKKRKWPWLSRRSNWRKEWGSIYISLQSNGWQSWRSKWLCPKRWPTSVRKSDGFKANHLSNLFLNWDHRQILTLRLSPTSEKSGHWVKKRKTTGRKQLLSMLGAYTSRACNGYSQPLKKLTRVFRGDLVNALDLYKKAYEYAPQNQKLAMR